MIRPSLSPLKKSNNKLKIKDVRKKREEKKEIDKSGSTEQIQKLINIIRKIKELRNSIT